MTFSRQQPILCCCSAYKLRLFAIVVFRALKLGCTALFLLMLCSCYHLRTRYLVYRFLFNLRLLPDASSWNLIIFSWCCLWQLITVSRRSVCYMGRSRFHYSSCLSNCATAKVLLLHGAEDDSICIPPLFLVAATLHIFCVVFPIHSCRFNVTGCFGR